MFLRLQNNIQWFKITQTTLRNTWFFSKRCQSSRFTKKYGHYCKWFSKHGRYPQHNKIARQKIHLLNIAYNWLTRNKSYTIMNYKHWDIFSFPTSIHEIVLQVEICSCLSNIDHMARCGVCTVPVCKHGGSLKLYVCAQARRGKPWEFLGYCFHRQRRTRWQLAVRTFVNVRCHSQIFQLRIRVLQV